MFYGFLGVWVMFKECFIWLSACCVKVGIILCCELGFVIGRDERFCVSCEFFSRCTIFLLFCDLLFRESCASLSFGEVGDCVL